MITDSVIKELKEDIDFVNYDDDNATHIISDDIEQAVSTLEDTAVSGESKHFHLLVNKGNSKAWV